MRCDQRCNCYMAEFRCCGCAVVSDWTSPSKCSVAPDEDRLTVEERPCCRRKGSCPSLALAGRCLCSCGGHVAQLPILAFSAA